MLIASLSCSPPCCSPLFSSYSCHILHWQVQPAVVIRNCSIHGISRATIHLVHRVGPSGACIAGVLLLDLAHLQRPMQITRLGIDLLDRH